MKVSQTLRGLCALALLAVGPAPVQTALGQASSATATDALPPGTAAADIGLVPGIYELDQNHTKVMFKTRHMGVATVTGFFKGFEARVEIGPRGLDDLSVSATVQTASVDSGVERRDNHLRSADFFDAEAYPQMRFESRGVRAIDGDQFELVGDLTIRDVTREMVLEAEVIGTFTDSRGRTRLGLEAEGRIDRFDYGLTWDRTIETGGLVVSREIRILLEVEALKPAPDETE